MRKMRISLLKRYKQLLHESKNHAIREPKDLYVSLRKSSKSSGLTSKVLNTKKMRPNRLKIVSMSKSKVKNKILISTRAHKKEMRMQKHQGNVSSRNLHNGQ